MLLGGCATSEIIPIGSNTYLISQTSAGGAFTDMGRLKVDVIKRANSFALQQGKVAIPVSEKQTNSTLGRFPNYEYQFKLVDESDHRAKDSILKSVPDRIIENRVIIENVKQVE